MSTPDGDDLARSSPFVVSGVGVQPGVISYLAELGAGLSSPMGARATSEVSDEKSVDAATAPVCGCIDGRAPHRHTLEFGPRGRLRDADGALCGDGPRHPGGLPRRWAACGVPAGR